MGRILALNPPYKGMSAIVNVLGRVGPKEQNSSDDVRVVQRLLQIGSLGGQLAASVGVPQLTGHFDAATGFWIFRFQEVYKRTKNKSQIVDGIVSPAHGAVFGGGAVWTIVIMNEYAKDHNPAEYAAFLAQSKS